MNDVIRQALDLTKQVLLKEQEEGHTVACSVSGGG